MTIANADAATMTWVLGIVGTVVGGAIVFMLSVVVKKFDALTLAVNANTQAIEIMKVEFKRVDGHGETLKEMKPRLDEVYWWGKQKGMRSQQGAEAS